MYKVEEGQIIFLKRNTEKGIDLQIVKCVLQILAANHNVLININFNHFGQNR